MGEPSNHFLYGGADYAAYRPSYPPDLAIELGRRVPSRALAIDVGCGTGQLTVLLADAFDAVLGVDQSASQIGAATPLPKISYVVGSCDALPAPDASAGLVSVGQAAHWFDLDAFYAECRRVLVPHGLVALITYGVTIAPEPIRARFEQFYWEELRGWWPAERVHVETGYADIPFPFTPVEPPQCQITRAWSVQELLGFVGTWSAIKRLNASGGVEQVNLFAQDLRALWPAEERLDFVWPISIRLGEV